MQKKIAKFLAILLFPAVAFSAYRRPEPRQETKINQAPVVAFEDCVKDVFNRNKSAIVRVVCISRPDEYQKDDSNMTPILAGTGFFVSDRADVITAASIVKNGQKIWVDYGGMSYPAECVGMDAATNIALLHLLQAPEKFGTVDIKEDDHNRLTEIGSFLVFVGCKLGLDPLPDFGHVTGKNISYSGNDFLTTYLRANLMFCGGESGAPVFEIDGTLAGVMVASLPEIASSFILPKRVLSQVYQEIKQNGIVKHRQLSIETATNYIPDKFCP